MKRKFIKPLASLKLAVFIIIAIAFLTAIGTIVEARYDAFAAKKLVYDTPWMMAIMILLAVNLIAVMVDRWPWKRRHAAFVCAHIGIIILMFGQWVTTEFGLDGTMRVAIGEKGRYVQVAPTDLTVYSSFDGDRYTKTLEQEVDFFLKPPTEEKPFSVATMDGSIDIVKYEKYVIPSKQVVPVEKGNYGAGVRFQIESAFFNVVEWAVQRKQSVPASQNFGPASVHLMDVLPKEGTGKNEIYFAPSDNETLKYVVFHKDSPHHFAVGLIREGDMFEPGWMGAKVRILRYLPKAREDWDINPVAKPTPLTTAAVKVRFKGNEQWVLQNDMVKFFTESGAYLLTWANRRIDLNFDLKLDHFEITRYQGTMRAMAYQSIVETPEGQKHMISMNEPLKYRGLTIYQASFQEENGQPVASIFSINQDPGRFLKYLGSLVMSIGIVLLFYFKSLDFKALKKTRTDND